MCILTSNKDQAQIHLIIKFKGGLVCIKSQSNEDAQNHNMALKIRIHSFSQSISVKESQDTGYTDKIPLGKDTTQLLLLQDLLKVDFGRDWVLLHHI